MNSFSNDQPLAKPKRESKLVRPSLWEKAVKGGIRPAPLTTINPPPWLTSSAQSSLSGLYFCNLQIPPALQSLTRSLLKANMSTALQELANGAAQLYLWQKTKQRADVHFANPPQSSPVGVLLLIDLSTFPTVMSCLFTHKSNTPCSHATRLYPPASRFPFSYIYCLSQVL